MIGEKSYARWVRAPDGKPVKRYSALDPADISIKCTCGRDECTRAHLLPFRDHVTELFQVLSRHMREELAVCGEWMSVLYGLRLAASLEDVEADTGYVEDPMVFALCEPAIDYENAASEMASKYVAGVIIFNFLWLAYESAVALTEPEELQRLRNEGRLGERGRRLLELRPEVSPCFPGLKDLVSLALLQCHRGGLMDQRLHRVEARFPARDLVTAAELCRQFRNFLFHGGDEVPAHEDWGDAIIARCRISRFYTVSRLLLYLIQSMAWITTPEGANVVEYGSFGDPIHPRRVLERLQFRGPGIWPALPA
jgi:hypothetical protein